MVGNNVTNMIFWLVVAFLGAIAMTILGILFYRWLKHTTQMDDDSRVPFSLADLRRLRDQELMTPQEYEQAKALMIARMNRDSSGASENQPDDGEASPPSRIDPPEVPPE